MKYKRKKFKWKYLIFGVACCLNALWIYSLVKVFSVSSPNIDSVQSRMEVQTNQTSRELLLRPRLRKEPVDNTKTRKFSNKIQNHSTGHASKTPVEKQHKMLKLFVKHKKATKPSHRIRPKPRTVRKRFRVERDTTATFVIDAFAFNGELDLLEMRLHELRQSVEAHIIVESAFDTYGNPKPLYFQEQKTRFSKFKHKIVYVKDTQPPAAKGCELGFRHLDAMRLMIVNPGFDMLPFKVMDHDILIITDADEIPSRYAVSMARKADWKKYDVYELFMRRSMFAFYWKMPNKQSQVANARKVGNHLAFIKMNERMKKETANSGFGNGIEQKIGRIMRGGWHCSWCSSPKEILRKLGNSLCGDGVRFGDFGYSLSLIETMQREGLPFGAKERHPLGKTPIKVTRGHAPPYALRHRSRYPYIIDPNGKTIEDTKIQMPYCQCSEEMKQIVSTYTLAMKNQIQPMMKYWCKEEVQVCLNLTDAELLRLEKLERGNSTGSPLTLSLFREIMRASETKRFIEGKQ